MLTGASHSDRPTWVICGQAAGVAPGAGLATIRSAQEQDRIVRPFYETRQRYIEIQAAEMGRHWAAHGARDQSWFPLWLEVDELLARGTPRPPILGYALLAYWSAWTRRLLEFSIPEFVRAAEGIIALPLEPAGHSFVTALFGSCPAYASMSMSVPMSRTCW